jgi:hypothetical protein
MPAQAALTIANVDIKDVPVMMGTRLYKFMFVTLAQN